MRLTVFYTNDTPEKVISVLAIVIDDCSTKSKNSIFIVGTTNDFENIPEAITRLGRIDKKIFIDRPNNDSRKEIITYYINKTECKFETNIEKIVRLTNKFLSAAIKTLVNECVINSDDNNFVSNDLVERKVNEILNEEISVDIHQLDAIATAYAELGRFVVAWSSFKNADYILNINQQGTSSGSIFSSCNYSLNSNCGVFYDEDANEYEEEKQNTSEGGLIYSKMDIINSIMIFMGAVAANILYNRGPYIIDYYYISEARDLIKSAIKCGLYGLENCMYMDLSENNYSCVLSDESRQKFEQLANEILQDAYDKARSIVKKGIIS